MAESKETIPSAAAVAVGSLPSATADAATSSTVAADAGATALQKDLAKTVAVSSSALDLWKKYEDVAMHFNDLIMRWRLQAIGGLATLVTVAGFVVGDAASLSVRYRAMFLLASMLAFVWIGVACIDLFYYRKLLTGAVESILDLEKSTPAVQLSTKIEQHAERAAQWVPWVFYIAGFIPLVLITGWAIYNLNVVPPATPNASTPDARAGGITRR